MATKQGEKSSPTSNTLPKGLPPSFDRGKFIERIDENHGGKPNTLEQRDVPGGKVK